MRLQIGRSFRVPLVPLLDVLLVPLPSMVDGQMEHRRNTLMHIIKLKELQGPAEGATASHSFVDAAGTF